MSLSKSLSRLYSCATDSNSSYNNNNNLFLALHVRIYTSVAVLISVQPAISNVVYTMGRVLDLEIIYRNSKPSHKRNFGTACNNAVDINYNTIEIEYVGNIFTKIKLNMSEKLI